MHDRLQKVAQHPLMVLAALIGLPLTVLSLPSLPEGVAGWGDWLAWVDDGAARWLLPLLGWLTLGGVVVAGRRSREPRSPDGLLDNRIKLGHEIREWMRFYNPPDDEARRRVMEWQVGTTQELFTRFPTYWDAFRDTGVVEGSGTGRPPSSGSGATLTR